MTQRPALLVFGAGAVGCHVGGRLQVAGATVRFIGSPRVIGALREHGLRLTSLDGLDSTLDPVSLALATEATPEAAPTLALLCVKSGATAEAAARLGACLPPGSVVLSLQNGITNAAVAAAAAPGLVVLPGVVGFNVAELSPGHYHQGSSGRLHAQDHPDLRALQPLFAAAGLPLQLHADLRPVQWGKLLLNLNNPVNALSGLPLREELMDRQLREVLAALQDEALQALYAADIRPARLTLLPPSLLPKLLRLPTWLFRLLAGRMLRIDANARSSMADDLARGRPTEIDAICGEVVRLCEQMGLPAPLNARMGLLMQSASVNSRPRSGRRLQKDLGLAK